jgi:hypothetical protein
LEPRASSVQQSHSIRGRGVSRVPPFLIRPHREVPSCRPLLRRTGSVVHYPCLPSHSAPHTWPVAEMRFPRPGDDRTPDEQVADMRLHAPGKPAGSGTYRTMLMRSVASSNTCNEMPTGRSGFDSCRRPPAGFLTTVAASEASRVRGGMLCGRVRLRAMASERFLEAATVRDMFGGGSLVHGLQMNRAICPTRLQDRFSCH